MLRPYLLSSILNSLFSRCFYRLAIPANCLQQSRTSPEVTHQPYPSGKLLFYAYHPCPPNIAITIPLIPRIVELSRDVKELLVGQNEKMRSTSAKIIPIPTIRRTNKSTASQVFLRDFLCFSWEFSFIPYLMLQMITRTSQMTTARTTQTIAFLADDFFFLAGT